MNRSRTYFTADTHFGCARTLRVRKRPFASLEAMDATLVARWNDTVGSKDEVYHLGDVATLDHADIGGVLGRLNGRIHLIIGNNDDAEKLAALGRFASIAEMRELTLDGQRVFLCHYPMRDWPSEWRGAWHLFGHVHGRFDDKPLGLSLDVGVDTHAYAPVSFAGVREAMARRPQPARRGAAAG